MPASRNPDSYPVAFGLLLDHFDRSDAAPVTDLFSRSAAAERTRFTFYNYKKALEAVGRTEDLRIANSILIRVRKHPDGSGTLEFSLRDNEPIALGLEAAIRRAQEGSGPRAGQDQPLPGTGCGGAGASPRSEHSHAAGGGAPCDGAGGYEILAEPRAADPLESLVEGFMRGEKGAGK